MNYSLLRADIHSHLLPGIDDGADSLLNALELISGLKNLGFSKLITTPHIRSDMYKNTPSIINKKCELVNKELQKRKIEIGLHAAAEYFLDAYVLELLKKKEPLLTIKDGMVLVEFSVMHQAMNMKELIFELLMAGYKPIIAHPERYVYFHGKYEMLHAFLENGCLFQMNLLSASGHNGKTIADMTNYLVENDFYDFVATDIHHPGHLERLTKLRVNQKIQNLISGNRLLNQTLV